MPPDTVGCLTKVITQICVACPGDRGVLWFKVTGIAFAPCKAGIFSQCIRWVESSDASDFRDHPSRPYRADSGDWLKDCQRIWRHALYGLKNSFVDGFDFFLVGFNAVEWTCQGNADRLIHAFIKAVGVTCSFPEELGSPGQIRDPVAALFSKELQELFLRRINDILHGHILCQQGGSSRAVDVAEGLVIIRKDL